MGYAGYLEYKIQARKLRGEGLSYSAIMAKIPVSKNTISRWCRDIIITEDQRQKLYNNQVIGGIKGSYKGSKTLQERRLHHTKKWYEDGFRRMRKITEREQLIAGIALYAAEGTKTDGRFEFTNSDPLMIAFMSSWLRRFFTINEARLHGVIWIHNDNDVNKAIHYWSEIAGIPAGQFHKSYIVANKHSAKIRKKKHAYGIFSLRYSDVTISRQMQGLIAGLLHAPWYNNRTLIPRSSTVEQDAVTRQRSGVIRDGKRGEFRET